MSQLLVAGAIFLPLYLALTVPMAIWPLDSFLLGTVTFGLYTLLALALAVDVTELILALLWSTPTTPVALSPAPRHKVAVLMTVCDDWTIAHFNKLVPLSEGGYDVFILDDSARPAMLPLGLRYQAMHLRRCTHAGAKAGNLNNWLWKHGSDYVYAVILDADSSMSIEAVDHLLLAAEHPQNSQVAIFQSKIEPASESCSLFSQVLGFGARPRTRILERVHAPLRLLLSFGHNQLLRLDPVRVLGGFDETLTNEDTVLTLDLVSTGWEILLLDVWSHDTEPPTIAAYTRRTVRWARQTVELFHQSWRCVPLRLKLLLCRHLLACSLPVVGASLLLLCLWTGPTELTSSWQFTLSALSFAPGYGLYGLTLWPILGIFTVSIFLRVTVARLEGVSFSQQLVSFLLGSGPYVLLLVPLAIGIVESAFGKNVAFEPTNSRNVRKHRQALGVRLHQLAGITLLFGLLIGDVVYRPGSLLVGFNFLWLLFLLLSPLSLLVIKISDYWSYVETVTPTDISAGTQQE